MRCWELERFWEEVEREIATLDSAEFEAFRAAEAPEADPGRVAQLRARICGEAPDAE